MVQVIKNIFNRVYNVLVKFGEFRAQYYIMKNTVQPVNITTKKD